MREQPTPPDDLHELRRQARRNSLRLKVAQQNEALAALRRSGFRDSLEDFYDPANFFDPRDYLFEVPRGFGGAIPTTRNDRDEGRDFPIFRTEQELAVIRGAARLLTSTSPIAVGILNTLTNYVIGNGFQYAVTSRSGTDQHFAAVASAVIDEFLDENGWVGDLDRELFQRSRVDGEYFLGLWHVGAGHVQARAVEPDQVTEPSNKSGIEAWLGCTGSLGCAASFVSSWTFGIHTDDTDAQAIHGYYVQWTNRDTEWDYFPGGNEPITPPDGASRWLEHAKLNVVRSVKRGLSDFYSIQSNLELARRVLRNMGEGSAVQAAIAWIQEAAPGVTQSQASSATLARADARYTTNSAQGSRTHTAQQYDPATILKVPSGQKYLPGPLGAQNAPSFITAAEALLRTVAVRWSLPENLVTGTAENNNFASSLVAESPFVKFAESQQQFYVQRDKRTLKRVLWFAWSAGRFGDVPWSLIETSVEITVTPPQIEVRDPEKETRVREMLNKAGILSRKTWSAQEGLDFEQEQKNLAAEAQTAPQSAAKARNGSNDQSPVESIEDEGGRDFDPSKHPRGGNPDNTGQFSKTGGPTSRAAEIVRQAANPAEASSSGTIKSPNDNSTKSNSSKNGKHTLWDQTSDSIDERHARLSDKDQQEFEATVTLEARLIEQRFGLTGRQDFGPEQERQLRDYVRQRMLHAWKVETYFSRTKNWHPPVEDVNAMGKSYPAEPDFLRRAMDQEAARRAADAKADAQQPTIRGISPEEFQVTADRSIIAAYERKGQVTSEETTEYQNALDRQMWRAREKAMSAYGDGYWHRVLGNLAFMANPANDGQGTFNDLLAPFDGLTAPVGGAAGNSPALGARRRPPSGRKSRNGTEPNKPSAGGGKKQPEGPPPIRGGGEAKSPKAPDPNWRSTQTGTTSGNSRILRKNLGIADGSGLDAHHLVASTDQWAQPARDLLDELQIDVNDSANGVALKPSGEKPAHHGHRLHSRDGMNKVYQRLKKAKGHGRNWSESRQNVLDELRNIRSMTENGRFP